MANESEEVIGEVTGSFWDTQTSGQTTSRGGIGATTAQMKQQSTYEAAGWDFENVWAINPSINNGYPYIQNRIASEQSSSSSSQSSESTDSSPSSQSESTENNEVPNSCPSGLADEYSLAGYEDGDFSTDPLSETIAYGVIWSGALEVVEQGVCEWKGESDRISGAYTGIHDPFLELIEGEYWQLTISTSRSIDNAELISWIGRKHVGASPKGSYTRVEGFDTTPTVDIIE
jgi:hypothetical protein